MMLAKFNCSPTVTQISSVTIMAMSRGTRVNATSIQRRSATNRISAMATIDRMPAWENAVTTLEAASMTKTGLPAASGVTARTAVTKRCRKPLSLAAAFGATSILVRPSVDSQACFRAGGSVSMLTGSAESRRLAWRSVVCSGATRACRSSSIVASGAVASGASTVARRRACAAAGLLRSPAAPERS
jgi:hypothetical protein